MTTFSEKYGHKSIKEIQLESMDSNLRNKLWNQINTVVPSKLYDYSKDSSFFKRIWTEYLVLPIDELQLKRGWEVLQYLKERYYNLEWYEVYDLLEYLINSLVYDFNKLQFILECNKILETEKAAYRFIGNEVVPITDKESITEIERALDSPLMSVKIHLETALGFYADRTKPDYRNSIKESISAVEALCVIITKNETASLGEALNILKKDQSINIPTVLNNAFSQIYGYTSSKDGIRHALTEIPNVGEEDARYMLITCSAFINYLLSKANKAKIIS